MKKLVSAYDIPYLKLDTMKNAEKVLDEFLAKDESVLLECSIDPMDLV